MKKTHRAASLILVTAAILTAWHERQAARERERDASTQARAIHAAQKAGTGCIELCPISGKILYADAEACDIFGYSPGTLAGNNLTTLMPAWLGAFHQHHVQDALARAKSDPKAPRAIIVRCTALDRHGDPVRVITRTFLDPDEDTMFAYVNRADGVIWKSVDPPTSAGVSNLPSTLIPSTPIIGP